VTICSAFQSVSDQVGVSDTGDCCVHHIKIKLLDISKKSEVIFIYVGQKINMVILLKTKTNAMFYSVLICKLMP